MTAGNASLIQTAAAYDLTDSDGWIDFISDAAFYLDDNSLAMDFILVSRNSWKDLAKLRDGAAADAPRLLDRNTGTINITGLSGNLFSVPVIPVNVAGNAVRVGSRDAITSWEAGGAPFRLSDEDITALTKAFSIYGYMAQGITNAAGLIRPTEAGDVV